MTNSIEEQIEFWRGEIYRAATNELEHTSWVFDELQDRIFRNIRWGFFRYHKQDHKELGWTKLLELNLPEFMAYEALTLSPYCQQFNHRTFGKLLYSDAAYKKVSVNFDYDIHLATTDVVDAVPFRYDEADFFSKWSLRAILPPAFVVFQLNDRYSDVQDWQWEYIDAYENWVNGQRFERREKYIQVGGWADFRQDGDYDTYVAQANTDHGDCGAVYLEYEDDKFYSYDQMC